MHWLAVSPCPEPCALPSQGAVRAWPVQGTDRSTTCPCDVTTTPAPDELPHLSFRFVSLHPRQLILGLAPVLPGLGTGQIYSTRLRSFPGRSLGFAVLRHSGRVFLPLPTASARAALQRLHRNCTRGSTCVSKEVIKWMCQPIRHLEKHKRRGSNAALSSP